MFDNTFRNCTDLDADKSGLPMREHESSFLLPQMMMIHAMPSGVSWQKTNCYQVMHNAEPSHFFNRLMHVLKRRIAP